MLIANTGDQPVQLQAVQVATADSSATFPVQLTGTMQIPGRSAITLGLAGRSSAQAFVPNYPGTAGSVVRLNLRFSNGTLISDLQTIAIPDPSQPQAPAQLTTNTDSGTPMAHS